MPANIAAPPSLSEPASVADPVPALRVLVVDDNQDSAGSLATLLRLWGHRVETALDGPSALALADSFRPQAALLDIGLPGMTGHELGRKLRESLAVNELLLIALSGYSQPQDQVLSAECGFAHHLVKPVDPDALQKLLNASSPSAG